MGEEACPICGYRLESSRNARILSGPDRRWLWLWFWGVFIGTPVLALLSAQFRQGAVAIPLMLVGTLVSGFLLAAVTKKNDSGLVVYAILYSAGLFVVYLGVAFVGCLVTLNNQHF